MRRSIFILYFLGALLALSACHKEPDFDARYDEAQDRIKATAADLDKDIKAPDGEDDPSDQ